MQFVNVLYTITKLQSVLFVLGQAHSIDHATAFIAHPKIEIKTQLNRKTYTKQHKAQPVTVKNTINT